MQQFRTIENGGLQYNLHPGQLRAFESTKRFVAMLAGTQSGKTCFGPVWLHREIETRGAGDYLAVEPNFDLFKLKLLPEMLSYFVDALKIGQWWSQDRIIEISEDLIPGKFLAKSKDGNMWARIILRSAEAEAGLESATAKAAWLDEAGHPDFNRTAWEAVNRRLSIHQGRCLLTTSLYDWGWLKTEIYDRWRREEPGYDVIQFDSVQNPNFPKEEYERAKSLLPLWKFDLFYRGRYSRPAGLIYDSFDEDQCKIKRRDIPKTWPVYVGHDFGPIHTSALWYAQDVTTGYLYLYRTYLSLEKQTAAGHVEKWKALSAGENIFKRVGGAVGSADEGWRQSYTLAGWTINSPLVKDVEVGIDRVYGWHKTNRLYVFEDLIDYLEEKMSYSRKLDDNYNPTEEIKDKSRYHLMDGERYILSDLSPVDVVSSGRPCTKHSSFRF